MSPRKGGKGRRGRKKARVEEDIREILRKIRNLRK